MSNNKINNSKIHIHQLPLELIANIIQYLNVKDIIALTSVSKIWRCRFLNQNVIWKRICKQLDIREEDYMRNPLTFCTKISSSSKEYMDFRSTCMFGPICHWWDTFNCYHRISKYIRNNGYCVVDVPHMFHVSSTYCFGDYIVHMGTKKSKVPVSIIVLKGLAKNFHHIQLDTCEMFDELFYNHIKGDKPRVDGNDKFLVFEMRSVIFVYTIEENYEFRLSFTKVVKPFSIISAKEETQDQLPDQNFLRAHNDTKIALYEHKLVVVHPKENKFFLINLNNQNTYHILQISKMKTLNVDCVGIYKERVMIGITGPPGEYGSHGNYAAIIYNLDTSTQVAVNLDAPVNQFIVNDSIIGIENDGPQSIFVRKKTNTKFVINSSTFAMDSKGKYIFFVHQEKLHQFSLSDKGVLAPLLVTLDSTTLTSTHFSSCLQFINNQFLLLNKTTQLWYDVYDLKNKVVVKSIKYAGFRLVYVGKRFIVMTNPSCTLIMGYS